MSKKKIYLSPSDQTKNMYAGGLGTEQQHCTEIAKCAKIALEAHGFEVKIGDNHRDELYPQRVAESNSWGADMHIPHQCIQRQHTRHACHVLQYQ